MAERTRFGEPLSVLTVSSLREAVRWEFDMPSPCKEERWLFKTSESKSLFALKVTIKDSHK